MFKKFILITAVIAMAIYGCKNISDNKTVSDQKSEPVIENVKSEPDNVKDFEQLESQNKLLAEQIAEKDAAVNNLKAELANTQGSVGNLQKEIESISDTKRNLMYVLIISLVINILLVIFIVWSRSQPKRLALPEGRLSKEPKKNNEASSVVKETTVKNSNDVEIQSDITLKHTDTTKSNHAEKEPAPKADNTAKVNNVATSPAMEKAPDKNTTQQAKAVKITDSASEIIIPQDQNKRKRGRPFGSKSKGKKIMPADQPKKRGRKPKNESKNTNKTSEATPQAKRGRGRPPKSKATETPLQENE